MTAATTAIMTTKRHTSPLQRLRAVVLDQGVEPTYILI
jgi:hypothetical protein